jgi:PKD repeat protein
VPGTLQVNASSTATSGTAPVTVDFAAGVQGGVAPYAYLWSFGDGQASTEPSPYFTYAAAGSYTATLVVTDAAGTTALSYDNVQVSATAQGLSVGASDTVTALSSASETVAFAGSARGGVAPYSFAWSFDDGSAASTLAAPTHTFASSGDFSVTLEVTDAHGDSARYDLNLVVVLSGLLVISSAGSLSDAASLSWGFAAAAAGGSGPYDYSWNFGDGSSTVTGATPSHTFAKGGTYLVVVTATSAEGNSTVHDMLVDVPAAPVSSSSGLLSGLVVVGVAAVLGLVVAVLTLQQRRMAAQRRGGARRDAPSGDLEPSAEAVLAKQFDELPPEKDVLEDMF